MIGCWREHMHSLRSLQNLPDGRGTVTEYKVVTK